MKENLINKSDKIYIAGDTGMVGSSIKKNLLKEGYGNKENGGELLLSKRKDLNLQDTEKVRDFISRNRPDIVIIAAAKVGGIFSNNKYPFEFLSQNLKIQHNLIEASFDFNIRRLLFLGSSCIYPKFSNQPIQEEELMTKQLEKTNEAYALAKICGIKMCEYLKNQNNFDAICLMPTNIYGPGDNYHPENSHVFASLIRKFIIAKKNNLDSVECWGTGSPRREFLHTDDLSKACIFALENWDPSCKNAPKDFDGNPLNFLNVGTGIDISIKDLAELIANELDYKGLIKWNINKPDGTPRKLLNISRFKSLGWEPKIKLKEGIKKTIIDVYDQF